MFNTIQNEGDKILVFDMRSLNDILNAHFNFNFKYDHTIPMPADYITENQFSMENFANWVPEKLFKDETLKKINMVNNEKLQKFKNRKRLYIFIIGA